jgi:hypothetical protein
MEWVSVKNLSLGVAEFHLVDEARRLAILKYNSHQQALRVQGEGHYGVFFFERTGGLLNRTIIKNEYGQEIGKLSFDKRHHHDGVIELESKKYIYSFEADPFIELAIYNKDDHHPLVSTNVKSGNKSTSELLDAFTNEEYTSLLVGLCWFQMFPSLKKNMAESLMVAV